MQPSKKPLALLSDEKKAKLALLIKAFNLDTTEVVIGKGSNMGHWVKNQHSGEWNVLRDTHGDLLWPDTQLQTPNRPVVETSLAEKPKCKFNPEAYVSFISDPDKARYQVKEVKEQPFGRTGFWCKLVDMYGHAAFSKLIESAELEACPLVGEIIGSGRTETITVY